MSPKNHSVNTPSKWPKKIAPLTPEQRLISDDFVKYWHEVLPRRYGVVEKFNQLYPVRRSLKGFVRTLEIGAGTGEHLEFETLTPHQQVNYVAVDIRENMVAEIRKRFSSIQAVVGDCQRRLEFDDGYFDRILAIHVLEHLPDLPSAVREMHRLCDKTKGMVAIVIPCEGGSAYSLARRLSAQRIFQKRYNQSYKWFIEREHVNTPFEIFEEMAPYFERTHRRYFPFPVSLEFCNLCIGATFVPK